MIVQFKRKLIAINSISFNISGKPFLGSMRQLTYVARIILISLWQFYINQHLIK